MIEQTDVSYDFEIDMSSAGDLVVRAVVRDDDEATRLKIDLGGLVLRDNKAVPLLDTSTWLVVRVVPDGGEDEGAALAAALDGAAACVLCSAAPLRLRMVSGSGACSSTLAKTCVREMVGTSTLPNPRPSTFSPATRNTSERSSRV